MNPFSSKNYIFKGFLMKSFLVLIFLIQSLFILSQNLSNFEIIQIGNKYSQQQVNLAFSQTNLCGYFKSNDFVQLTLDDSTIIRLKKKTDLEQIGIYLNSECFDIKNFQPDSEIWRISDSTLICEKKRLKSKFK